MILPNRFLTSFNPHNTHIALATKAKLFDPTFTTTSSLFIYDYKTKKYLCEYQAPTRYNTLEYINEKIIVGGMEDGTIEIYSIDDNDTNLTINPVFSNNTLLSGDILSITHNITKNMLAISSQNKKFILLNTQTYKAFSPGLTIYEDLVALKWNPKVSHILAALNTKNEILVFDLKTKREVIRTKKDIGECKKIWWCKEKSTCLYVFGEKGTYLYDLSCDKIERVCEGGISIYKVYDKSETIDSMDKQNSSNSSFIVCGDTFISYKNMRFAIDPIFDAQFKNDFVCLSFFDRTEMLKIEDLFKKNGFLYGKRKELLSVCNDRIYVYGDKMDVYKMNEVKMNESEIDECQVNECKSKANVLCDLYNNKNVIEFFMQFYEKKEYDDFCIKKDEIFDIFENKDKFKSINKEKDREYCEDHKNEDNCEDTNIYSTFYNVTVPFSLFTKLDTKNISDLEYNKINDAKVVFLLSKFCNKYDFLVQNINVNDFYILFIFLYEQSINASNKINSVSTNGDNKNCSGNEPVFEAIRKLAMRLYASKKKEASYIYLVLKDIIRFYEIQTEIIGSVKIENYVKKEKNL